MEAEFRLRYRCSLAIAGLLTLVLLSPSFAASQRTQNFLINAPTPQLAQAVAEAAERYRRDLAIHWLGGPLPPWPTPCPIHVVAGDNLAAQGVTTYKPAPVRDFQMEVVGTPERILDSVLPHEVTHTILATYFGRPLPRWADEGICTTVEHASERSKHDVKLREFLRSRRGIAMNQLFLMKEYPADVLPMYAQGYSVCRFLIDQKGPRTFIDFLGDYMKHPSWTANVKRHYGYDSLKELQDYWLSWVSQGAGPVEKFAKIDVQPARQNTGQVAQVSANEPATAASMPAVASAASLDLALQGPARVASSVNLPSPAPRNPVRGAPNSPAAGRPEPAATALASTSNSGWYQRKRRDVELQDPNGVAHTAVTPIIPPSVRDSGPYRSAHPQAEQQMSRSGTPLRWAGGTPDASGQFVR